MNKGQQVGTGITDENQDVIFELMKTWKQRAEQAISVVKLHQRCRNKSNNPKDFFYEIQAEQILNKYDL